MRRLRPEYYSDSADRTAYQLDAPLLGYQLDNITKLNLTHEFEIFCRKLCQRTICPNLKPATGPEGGGDSKADTETVPLADELATLVYVGLANAGRERWAFAFSAKQTWSEKVRRDVAGIADTDRGYTKVFFVTSRFARAKDRARIEDELSRQYGFQVTILDRSWIIEQVIDGDRKDLAFNYLHVGQEVAAGRLGPDDYSRTHQLEDIEKALSDPDSFVGAERQRAMDALVAAKASRNLERPRVETEGRFMRAIRLAKADGTYRQHLEAEYEWLWSAFWYFDDIATFNSGYDAFGTMALQTDHAKNVGFLCNLAQNLFNAVIHDLMSEEEAQLSPRIARLKVHLEAMAADTDRPNNALEARTSLLILELNQTRIDEEPASLGTLWPRFSEILRDADGMGEFDVSTLLKLIEALGAKANGDQAYADLVDQTAEFVARRTGEAQGALILLRRAQQLDLDHSFEIIRLLGKAAPKLIKKEYADDLISAQRLLGLAYKNVGLFWVARASFVFANASMVIEAEEDHSLTPNLAPSLIMLAWTALDLGHLPQFLEAMSLLRGCVALHPVADESFKELRARVSELDMMLTTRIANFDQAQLAACQKLPDILERLELFQSRSALMYALGYLKELRTDGWIPAEETDQGVQEHFAIAAAILSKKRLGVGLIADDPGPGRYTTRVLGIRIDVDFEASQVSILVAEATIAAIEALFATLLDVKVAPHVERFVVSVQEVAGLAAPDFTFDVEAMSAQVRWPEGLEPAGSQVQTQATNTFMTLAATIYAATCMGENLERALARLADEEAAVDRIALITINGNSHSRVFGRKVARLGDWTTLEVTDYPIRPDRPSITPAPRPPKPKAPQSEEKDDGPTEAIKRHTEMAVRSVIDIRLWDKAAWRGTAYIDAGPMVPPAIALPFVDGAAGRRIFERWRERFGEVDEDDALFLAIIRKLPGEPSTHYRVMISARLDGPDLDEPSEKLVVSSRSNLMTPNDNEHLERFLHRLEADGCYLLMPASITPQMGLSPHWDLAIVKRQLSVKSVCDIGPHDLEMMALRPSPESSDGDPPAKP